jgi:uncharacterized secreted protein with C-terminal beta-propeller domain
MSHLVLSPNEPGTHTRRWRTAALAVTLGVAAIPVATSGPASAATKRSAAKAVQASIWQRFTSCEKFLAYIRPEALKVTGPYGLDGYYGVVRPRPVKKATAKSAPRDAAPATTAAAAAAAPEAVSAADAAGNSSGTNTQEAGVDEGDMTETDGRYVYVARTRTVDIVDTKADAANPAARTARPIASISLPANSQGAQLILSGTFLAVMSSSFSQVGPSTVVSVYDVSTPSAPKFISRRHLEGSAVSARGVDGRVRLILQTSLGTRLASSFVQPTSNDQSSLDRATSINRRVVRTAPIGDWLPRTFEEDATGGTGPVSQALSCGEIGRPSQFAGLAITWVATISLDPASPRRRIEATAGVVGSGSTVYASTQNLYVATSSWEARFPRPQPAGTTARRQLPRTEIHTFDMNVPDGARWVASGSVPGTLLNQFALSEFDGVLRVATTESGGGFGGDTSSTVRTFQRTGRTLTQLGQVGGLGRNEQIFGVRFLGSQGYVVTFRQTDPLYVIDLRNPREPRLAGELKIPGYSAYLHPIGDGKIIGIGQDADANGRRLGTQIAVFDVSNPSDPKRISQLTVGGNSEAEYNHLAFLWWGPTRDVVIPTTPTFTGIPDPKTGVVPPPNPAGASVLRIGAGPDAAITNRGSVLHVPANQPNPPKSDPNAPSGDVSVARVPVYYQVFPIRRSMIVDGALVTVSDLGILVSNLDTLTPTAWQIWA